MSRHTGKSSFEYNCKQNSVLTMGYHSRTVQSARRMLLIYVSCPHWYHQLSRLSGAQLYIFRAYGIVHRPKGLKFPGWRAYSGSVHGHQRPVSPLLPTSFDISGMIDHLIRKTLARWEIFDLLSIGSFDFFAAHFNLAEAPFINLDIPL